MIPLFKMSMNTNDGMAVLDVLARKSQWADGPEVSQFEQKICDYMKVKYCVVFNSGTSALHATMLAYGIKEGDEVIVPSFTFIATANCVRIVGATPVFADIEDKTYGLDVDDVKRKITHKTKAIIAVHYAGCPCQIEKLRALADEEHLLLIEDAAEAMGAEVNGVKVGTIGNAGVLSFCQNKIITTGEGGAVVTNDKEIYEKLKLLVNHGKPDYEVLGYNWRMPSMNAALGISQLERIDELIEKRRDLALNHYYPPLIHLHFDDGVEMGLRWPQGGVFQMMSVCLPDRDNLMKYLRANGVSCGIWFNPVHKTPYYHSNEVLPVTERVSSEILSLPMYPDLTTKEIEYVCQKVREFYA